MTEGGTECQVVSEPNEIQQSSANVDMVTTDVISLPPAVTKEEICQFLSFNPKVFFKSQQIDDPDLTSKEKESIALDVYNSNQHKFLLRFGKYLQEEHLRHFETVVATGDDEMIFLIKDLINSLQSHDRDVKNRRYAAMQTMIREGSYFSECEMMKREPHLYEQMVGQYLTDMEKRLRDRSGEDCKPFSSILLENYDKDQIEKLRKMQEKEDYDSDEETTMSTKTVNSQSVGYSSENDKLYPEIPASQRKRWGGFEDEDEKQEDMPTVRTRRPKNKNCHERLITAGEREMLRQEFLGIMYEKFLGGEDKDFDYAGIDSNTDLDDLDQIRQDSEDKYFDDDDDEVMQEEFSLNEKRDNREDDSEDDLEIYMKHLNRHPTIAGPMDT